VRDAWSRFVSEVEPRPQIREVSTIDELVQFLDLAGIRFYELAASWDDTGDAPEDQVDDDPQQLESEFRTAYRKRPDGVDYRVSVRVLIPAGELRADAAAMYVGPEAFSVPEDVIFSFGENVAAMTVLPYIRQAITDLSIRVGPGQVVLPIISRGVITFSDDSEDQDGS
jgi:hypothetical protein